MEQMKEDAEKTGGAHLSVNYCPYCGSVKIKEIGDWKRLPDSHLIVCELCYGIFTIPKAEHKELGRILGALTKQKVKEETQLIVKQRFSPPLTRRRNPIKQTGGKVK